MDRIKIYSTKELAELTAGGDSYIRTKNNVVKGLALTIKLNPEAPRIIVVGDGPRIKQNAELLAQTKVAVPAFVKLGVNQWRYKGEYNVLNYSKSISDIEKHRKGRALNRITGIIFLEKNKLD